MFKKFQYPKIIAPFLIIASFFAMVGLQLLLEEEIVAKETQLLSEKTQLYNDRYQDLLNEAKTKGFKYDQKEKPVLLVNFWASWCQPCLREFHSMKKSLKKHDHLQILGVNQDDSVRKMMKAQKKYKLPFFSYLDKQTKMADSLGIEEYPFSIIYCKGKALKVFEGETDFNTYKIERAIKKCK